MVDLIVMAHMVCVNECARITQEKEAAPLSSAKEISGPT